jgi:hypothetical protein
VATAQGYGPAWSGIGTFARGAVTLRLIKDDIPIRGRILDLQGKPVAGATVRLLQAGEGMGATWMGPAQTVKTGKDGRFRLTGIGRDREVILRVEGPAIETKDIKVQTRKSPRGKGAYGATVDHFAGPTKPVLGTVRDRATKKPLAGVLISASHEGGHVHQFNRSIRTVTDSRGRYKLLGLPKRGSYELWATPNDRQTYLPATRTVTDTDGLKPLTLDFGLRRGVRVRCRLIDRETRQTVRGHIQYDTVYNHPNRKEAYFPMFGGHAERMDKDGFFNFVVFPGPGLIYVFRSAGVHKPRYLPARVNPADKKAFPFLDQVPFTGGGVMGVMGNWNCPAYRLINSDKAGQTLTFDIELTRGRALKGVLVGPDDKPVTGARAFGTETLKTDAFTARDIDPRYRQTLSFAHKDRKLIGFAVVGGTEKEPVKVRLRPWGTVTGRLVDAGGKPRVSVRLELRYLDKDGQQLPEPGIKPPFRPVQTDTEGRFRVQGLAPGLKHQLVLLGGAGKGLVLSAGEKLKGLTVEAGLEKKVGDVRADVVPAPK